MPPGVDIQRGEPRRPIAAGRNTVTTSKTPPRIDDASSRGSHLPAPTSAPAGEGNAGSASRPMVTILAAMLPVRQSQDQSKVAIRASAA